MRVHLRRGNTRSNTLQRVDKHTHKHLLKTQLAAPPPSPSYLPPHRCRLRLVPHAQVQQAMKGVDHVGGLGGAGGTGQVVLPELLGIVQVADRFLGGLRF